MRRVTYIFVTVLLNLAVFTLSDEKIKPKVGDLCCFEDWENAVAKFQAVAKLGDVESPKYKAELDRWSKGIEEFMTGTPRGVCAGHLTFVCNKASEKCECATTEPFKYLPTKDGRCVGDKESNCKPPPSGDMTMDCRKGFKCVERPKAKDKLARCEVDPNAAPGAGDDEIDLNFRSGGDGGGNKTGTASSQFPLIWLLLIGFLLSISYVHCN